MGEVGTKLTSTISSSSDLFCSNRFNDADLPVDTWKVMMYSEIIDFHNIENGEVPSEGAVPPQAQK